MAAGIRLRRSVATVAAEEGKTIAGWSSSGLVRSACTRSVCTVAAGFVGSAVHCGSQAARQVGSAGDTAGKSSKLATLRHHTKCRQAAEARPSSATTSTAMSITAALLSAMSNNPDTENSVSSEDVSASLLSSLLDELPQALELSFGEAGV